MCMQCLGCEQESQNMEVRLMTRGGSGSAM